MKLYCVYILECCDASYYTGITTNFERRFKQHNKGKGAKYTSVRIPLKLLFKTDCVFTKSEALKIEYTVKQQKRINKLNYLKELINGRPN